jgi:hypothetical protein
LVSDAGTPPGGPKTDDYGTELTSRRRTPLCRKLNTVRGVAQNWVTVIATDDVQNLGTISKKSQARALTTLKRAREPLSAAS